MMIIYFTSNSKRKRPIFIEKKHIIYILYKLTLKFDQLKFT